MPLLPQHALAEITASKPEERKVSCVMEKKYQVQLKISCDISATPKLLKLLLFALLKIPDYLLTVNLLDCKEQ